MNGVQKTIKILAIIFAVFLIFNIFRGIMMGLYFFGNVEPNRDTIREQSFSETYSEVNKIDIETVSSNIKIKSGDEFKVTGTNLKNNFSSRIINGTLKIEETKFWFWTNGLGGEITVYVPKKINSLKIDSGAGKVDIENITVEYANIDQGAGRLCIENSKLASSKIAGGAGETIVKSSELNNLKLDAGVGKIDLNGKITGNSKIECGIGEININLIGEEKDYYITAERGIGSIKIDGREQTVYGSGKNRIKLEGGIGAINVRFNEDENKSNHIENDNIVNELTNVLTTTNEIL